MAVVHEHESLSSVQPEAPLGEAVERPPEQRLSAMTKTDITAMPSATRGKSPARSPRRCRRRARRLELVSPQLATSATMLAFQEPPEAVSAPVT